MQTYQKIARIKEQPKGYYSERIAAELVYAQKITELCGGRFQDVVDKAADYLIDEIRQNSVITKNAVKECENILMPISNEAKKYKMHCVGHAHIDMNWMWGFNETVAITLETFRTVLNLMKEYPDLTFSQSQASTYKIVEQYDPGMFEDIRSRVAEGRWEVTASTWVEGDKNMANGESLARQMLYTKRYFKEKFDLDSEDLALDFEPDTFGHNAFMPEILNRGKVKYYYHCRGNNDKNIYNWSAPSGERVLVYNEPIWYNSQISADIIEYVPEFCNRHGIDFMLRVYGVGDHGGGPTRRDIERILDMSAWPIAPKMEFSTYRQFFRELELYREKFETVTGELNYIFTGCYSSQSRIKSANRAAEDNLFTSEASTALSVNFANGKNYGENYKKAWERTLFNQFHDILPGSGTRETREYSMGLFQETIGYTYAGRAKAIEEITGRIDTSSIVTEHDTMSFSEGGGVGFPGVGGHYTTMPERGNGKTRIINIFNFTQYERNEITEITIWDYIGNLENLHVTDAENNPVLFKVSGSGNYWVHTYHNILIYAKIKPFGYNTYIIREKEADSYQIALPKDPKLEIFPENIMENNCVRAVFNDNMELISFTDKKTGANLIEKKSAFFMLSYHNHRTGTVMSGNAWVEGFVTKQINLNEEEKVFILQRVQDNPLRQSIKYNIPFGKSNLDVTVSLDMDSFVLKYQLKCDWHEVFSQDSGIPSLKFFVPFSYKAEGYTYKVPSGTVKHNDTNHDVPAIGMAFAENGADSRGVAILTDSIYAYRGEKNALSLTILRASQEPDQYPEYGMHTAVIGVAAGSADKEDLYKLCSDLSYPLYFRANASHKGDLPMANSFVRVKGNISVSTLKVPEDKSPGLLVRVHDISLSGGRGTISFNNNIVSAEAVDLIEEAIEKPLFIDGSNVSFDMKPGEIVSLLVTF